MNQIALYFGERAIYWSSLIITLGVLCCLSLTVALYRRRSETLREMLVFFPLAVILSLFLSRLLCWYFSVDVFDSFGEAFSDFSLGSFYLPGVILGVWLAAWIVEKLRLVQTGGLLLDCTAPGLALLIAFIRLSALFNDTCRSRIEINTPLFKSLPFAVSRTDAAGNETWVLATFFLAFLAMLLLAVFLLRFYLKRGTRKMRAPCARTGNVWRMFLLYYAAIEVVVDSLRNDSPLMHFHLIVGLNKYSSFVSLAQVFAACTALYVLVYYSRKSIQAGGYSYWHGLSWAGFVLSLVGIGYLGEYQVQRSGKYLLCYSAQIFFCILMVVIIRLVYESCAAKRKRKTQW